MPRVCSICIHPELAAIDRALIESTPNRRIATRFGVTEASVRRHAERHLPSTMVLAKEAAKVTRADGLLEEAWRLQDKAAAFLARAEKTGSPSAVAQALQSAQRGLALMAQLRAQMPEAAGSRRFTITWRDSQSAPCERCGYVRPVAAIPSPSSEPILEVLPAVREGG